MDNEKLFSDYFELLNNGGAEDFDDYDDGDKPRKRLRPITSKRTIQNHMDVLLPFKEWIGDREIDKETLKAYTIKIKKHTFGEDDNKRHYSDGTEYQIRSVLRRFASWIDPTLGARIKQKPMPKKDVQILKPEDIDLMITKGCSARNNRDRALVAFLWESGCRKGEVQNIKIKDIVEVSDGGIGDNGIKITVNGKTGERTLKLIECYSYLRQWLEVHPRRDDPEAPLFCSTQPPYAAFSYAGIKMQLEEIGRRAKIPQHVYPHLFRHSRASYLANYFTEAQLNFYFGWTVGSNQARTYVHLAGRDVERAVDSLHGLADAKPEQTVIKCKNCKSSNNIAHARCYKCNYPLHEELRTETNSDATKALTEAMMLVAKDPELAALFMAALSGNKDK